MQFPELQQQSEENFELCEILEAQLPAVPNEEISGNESEDCMMYDGQPEEDKMERDFEQWKVQGLD